MIDHTERTLTYVRPKDVFSVQGVELLLQNKWYYIRDMTSDQVLILTELGEDAVQWLDKDFVESHCDVAKEVDGHKWLWDGLWRLEDNKYFEVVHMLNSVSTTYVLTTNNIDDEEPEYISETLHEALEMGVKLFIKEKRKSILNRMTDMIKIANYINNERYIDMLDSIYTDFSGRDCGLTENEIILLNEISRKMAIML